MRHLQNNDLVVIDLETSGINPFVNDVLAIGLVSVFEPEVKKTIYVKHLNLAWSDFALQNFTKFSSEWEKNAVDPITACFQIETFLSEAFSGRKAIAIGHNIGFDISFLRKIASQAKKSEIRYLSHRAIDTHTILYMLFLKGVLPQSATNSDGAFEYFGITIPEKDRHTALGDAIATRLLFLELLELI